MAVGSAVPPLPYSIRFPFWVPQPPGHDPCLSIYNQVPYFITEISIYSLDLGSGQRVLMQLEEFDQGGKFLARAILPKEVKFKLPRVPSKTPDPDHQLSRLSFVAKTYQLRTALPCIDSHGKRVEGKWEWDFSNTHTEAPKIVIISSKSDDGDVRYDPESEFSAVALLRKGSNLALLRKVSYYWDWDTGFCSGLFEDIAVYKGQLCTLDHMGRAFLMDYNSLEMTQVPASLCTDRDRDGCKQLVEVCGDLYLFVKLKELDAIVEVKVFKPSLGQRRWVEVELGRIGNQVFYMDSCCLIPIPVDVLPSV